MKLALSKTGRFLSKAEILGVGVLSPLSKKAGPKRAVLGHKKLSLPSVFYDYVINSEQLL